MPAQLDASTFPHIVNAIVRAASPEVQASFRGVSRRFRALVDGASASHLVLESVSMPVPPIAAVHNGVRCLLRQANADASPPAPIWPPHSALTHTHTLDVRGSHRALVLNALAANLPRLDTLRLYEYYAAPPGPLARKTILWGSFLGVDLPPARRLVLFSSLEECPHAEHHPCLPQYYPPRVREVVLCLRLPSNGAWGRLEAPPVPPKELRSATAILVPGAMLACSEPSTVRQPHDDDLGGAWRAIEDLAVVLWLFRTPATLVGWEHLDRRLLDRGVLAPFEEDGVVLRRTEDVRREVGEREWDIMTTEAPLPSAAWMV